MRNSLRHLSHILVAYGTFYQNEQSEVKTPDYIVPVCAVPEACAEPYEKEVEVFSSLTEDRNIQQVVTEECTERDVPSLPELSDILADKWITEVFVKVETEYTSKTYGYIGISGEVEVNLHSVDYYCVPRSDNGQRRKIAGLEERIDDSAEVVCKDDLFAKTHADPCNTLAYIGRGYNSVVYLVFDYGIADNGTCNELWEHRNVHKQLVPASLHLYLAPVAVEDIRDNLECEEADAYRHFNMRNGQIHRAYCIEVFNKEACILEEHKKSYIEHKRTGGHYRSFFSVTELIYKKSADIVYGNASYKQEYPHRLAPCVEYH